ncbi:MAG: hypothetical protein JWR33_2590 [Naasia sp.]|jgi:hypothetical protein|uniref:hypothetical protein n=1 Tax=Naasia sp. TaxID=2546198 RepID=UPI002629F19C|nr:hypothetical protein [Naasia sp.]MCU1571849.1 hypothetical protein [Naasia sp.]
MHEIWACTVCAGLALAVPSWAAGQARSPDDPPPPPLTAETLLANATVGSGAFAGEQKCKPDGSGTLRIAVSGVALGPYPGSFSETVTVTLGPTDGSGGGKSPVTGVAASFVISSSAGEVTGTKTLYTDRGLDARGRCADAVLLPVRAEASSAWTAESRSLVHYSAMIATESAVYHEEGLAQLETALVPTIGAPSAHAEGYLLAWFAGTQTDLGAGPAFVAVRTVESKGRCDEGAFLHQQVAPSKENCDRFLPHPEWWQSNVPANRRAGVSGRSSGKMSRPRQVRAGSQGS